MRKYVNMTDTEKMAKKMGFFVEKNYGETHLVLVRNEYKELYVTVDVCEDILDLQTLVMRELVHYISVRAIFGEEEIAENYLHRINMYFEQQLSMEDIFLIDRRLNRFGQSNELRRFIRQGFPMNKLTL